MGIQFKKRNPKMNKLFLACLAFAMVAVAYGLPTEEFNIKMPKEQKQCAAQKFMLNKLATLKKGDLEQPKDCGSDIIGCVASLAGTIASCAISVVQWELVVACVAAAIGAGDSCYDCVCEAVEWTCGCDIC